MFRIKILHLFLQIKQDFKVNYAPVLSQTPESAKGQVFVFANGISGNGSLGFQNEVMNAKPGDKNYSPLFQVNLVNWNDMLLM